jgi:5'-nucleotidase
MTPLARLAPAALLAPALLASGPATAQEGFTLRILHVNDFHSRLEQINRFDSACGQQDAAEGKCFGGAARLTTAVRQARAGSNLPTIFLNAGDNYQGSLFFTSHKGLAEAMTFNAMGVDAMVLGNHEFDNGPDGLRVFLDAAEFPVIAGNVRLDAEPALAGTMPSRLVLEAGGERVGIIGAVTADTVAISSPGPNLVFADVIEHLRAEVAALEAEGVTRIIALTHVGHFEDLRIAAEVPGIDVIIGGHSHTLMSNTVDGAPPYPVMAAGPDGPVPVAQAYAYGKWLGDLRVTFDAEGRVSDVAGEPILVDAAIAEDEAVLAMVAALAEPIEALRAQVIGETAEPVDGSRENCRARECAMGALVAEAMLARAAPLGAQVAIQNGGGLRASIDAGPVTMGEVLTVLPFQNTLATFTLTGAEIVEALENGLSQVAEGAGRFPQVAGLRFVWSPAAEPGSRVVSVEVETAAGLVPLDPAADYGVVSNNFMRAGGDGYAVFRDKGRNAYDFGPNLEDVLADHIAANSPYAPRLPGRIIEQP